MTAPTIAGAASYYALDQAYRAAVAQTSILVAGALQLRWTSLDPTNLAGTSTDFLADAVRLILAGRGRAINLANAYTEQVRRLSVPSAPPFTPPNPRPPSLEQIRTSVEFVGIRETARDFARIEATRQSELAKEDGTAGADSANRSAAGARQRVMDEGLRRTAGTAVRFVTTAGHDQVIDNVRADKAALGWTRTTKPACCFFCAMLASRGPVYKQDSFEQSNARFIGLGDHKVHDNCGCGLRPLYSAGDPLPERSEEFDQLWIDHAARFSGPEAIKAFRKAYEASDLAKLPEAA